MVERRRDVPVRVTLSIVGLAILMSALTIYSVYLLRAVLLMSSLAMEDPYTGKSLFQLIYVVGWLIIGMVTIATPLVYGGILRNRWKSKNKKPFRDAVYWIGGINLLIAIVASVVYF